MAEEFSILVGGQRVRVVKTEDMGDDTWERLKATAKAQDDAVDSVSLPKTSGLDAAMARKLHQIQGRSTGSDALDAVRAGQDDAVDSVSLPATPREAPIDSANSAVLDAIRRVNSRNGMEDVTPTGGPGPMGAGKWFGNAMRQAATGGINLVSPEAPEAPAPEAKPVGPVYIPDLEMTRPRPKPIGPVYDPDYEMTRPNPQRQNSRDEETMRGGGGGPGLMGAMQRFAGDSARTSMGAMSPAEMAPAQAQLLDSQMRAPAPPDESPLAAEIAKGQNAPPQPPPPAVLPPPPPGGSGSFSPGGGSEGGGFSMSGVGPVPATKNYEPEMRRLSGETQRAMAAQGAVEQSNAQKLAQGHADAAEQQRQQADAMLRAQDSIAARNEKAQKDVDLATQEWGKVAKIDPDRYWNERGTSAKMLAVFGAALSGISGNNSGWQLMQRLVDRDIDAQKEDIANHKAAIGAKVASKQNMVKFFMDQGHDQMAAAHMAAGVMYNAAQQQIESLKANAQGDEAKAKLDVLAGQLKQSEVQHYQSAAQKNTELEIQKMHYRLAAETKMAALAEKSSGTAKISATEEKTRAEVTQRTQTVLRNIDNLGAMIDAKGTAEVFGEHESVMKRALTEIAVDLAKLGDAGNAAMAGEVKRELDSIGVRPGDMFMRKSTAKAILQNLKRNIQNRSADFYKAHNVTPPTNMGGPTPEVGTKVE